MTIEYMKDHITHYIPLVGILCIAVAGMYTYSFNADMQRYIIAAAASGYLVWGVVHHRLHDDLSLEVFLEYFFIAIIGTALAFSVV